MANLAALAACFVRPYRNYGPCFPSPTRPELLTYAYVRLGSTAHECWLVVYPRVNLSNDSWCASAFRWDSFRAVPAPQAVSLPVSYVLLCAILIHQRVLQMALIDDCHGGSVLGRVQWFSY